MSKGKLTAGDKGGFSYSPPKSDGVDDPGPRCPKCGWHVSRAVKAEDRTVVIACLNARCDYTLTLLPRGHINEAYTNMPTLPGDDDSSVSAPVVPKVRHLV